MKYSFRVPLIIFTPKSLLRHPQCKSPVKDFIDGKFLPLIDDETAQYDKVEKILLCSGKIYFELMEYKLEHKQNNTAIIRLEQLYPLPYKALNNLKEKYSRAKEIIWVQEEPENMGAWPYILRKLPQFNFILISRKASAVPATGFPKIHLVEQRRIILQAFDKDDDEKIKQINLEFKIEE